MKYIFTAILTLGMLANVAHAGDNYRVNGFVEHYFTTKLHNIEKLIDMPRSRCSNLSEQR